MKIIFEQKEFSGATIHRNTMEIQKNHFRAKKNFACGGSLRRRGPQKNIFARKIIFMCISFVFFCILAPEKSFLPENNLYLYFLCISLYFVARKSFCSKIFCLYFLCISLCFGARKPFFTRK